MFAHFQLSEGDSDWKQEMESALDDLLNLLQDEHTISAYELQSSGLVQTLFSTLNVSTVLCLPFCILTKFLGHFDSLLT